MPRFARAFDHYFDAVPSRSSMTKRMSVTASSPAGTQIACNPHARVVNAPAIAPAGFAELIARAATPAHLAGPDTETDLERFASVSAELGDQILGPPGTVRADL
jgi:hypothetical protein